MFDDQDPDFDDGLLLADVGARPLRVPRVPTSGRVLRAALAGVALLVLVGLILGLPHLAATEIGSTGSIRKLGNVTLTPVPGDLPSVVVEVGQRGRVQVGVLREVAPKTYRPVMTRRLGVVGPGTESLHLGSGHTTDGNAPGRVLDSSRLLPFTVVPGEAGGLAPGRYAVSVQMRSVS